MDALRNFVLNGSDPRGYASDEDAAWLIRMVEADGKVCSLTELELLVQVIEKGLGVPEALKAYALNVIETAVLSGTGPTRDGGELSDTHVTAAEAQLLRRMIFGSASDKPGAVSLREAEMLFRLKDATLHLANAPEFQQVFVQGVGNALMGYANEAAHVDRARMLELEAFVANNKPSVGRFMGQMAREVPNVFGIMFGKRKPSPRARSRLPKPRPLCLTSRNGWTRRSPPMARWMLTTARCSTSSNRADQASKRRHCLCRWRYKLRANSAASGVSAPAFTSTRSV
ncbi:MAG: hypothetical protein V4647_14860 [Pseudomonadota bacterium]